MRKLSCHSRLRGILPGVLAICCLLMTAPTAWGRIADEEDVELTTGPAGEDLPEGRTTALPGVSALIVESTNEFRREQTLQVVKSQPSLMQAAQYFAEFMARTNKYGHTADGQRPADRAKEHGYEYCIVSENIAYVYSPRKLTDEKLAQKFVEGWKQSPGHRKNMLDADISETGVAVAQSEATNYFYAVQMFGRPKSASIEFEVRNRSGAEIEYTIGDKTFSLPSRYTRTHQRCRPKELTFQWPEDNQQDRRTVQPATGDRFIITQQSGQFQVGLVDE